MEATAACMETSATTAACVETSATTAAYMGTSAAHVGTSAAAASASATAATAASTATEQSLTRVGIRRRISLDGRRRLRLNQRSDGQYTADRTE